MKPERLYDDVAGGGQLTPAYTNPADRWPPAFFEAPGPLIIAQSPTHIVVAVDIRRTATERYRRFVANVLAAPPPP